MYCQINSHDYKEYHLNHGNVGAGFIRPVLSTQIRADKSCPYIMQTYYRAMLYVSEGEGKQGLPSPNSYNAAFNLSIVGMGVGSTPWAIASQ